MFGAEANRDNAEAGRAHAEGLVEAPCFLRTILITILVFLREFSNHERTQIDANKEINSQPVPP